MPPAREEPPGQPTSAITASAIVATRLGFVAVPISLGGRLLAGAMAAAEGIEAYLGGDLEVRALQDYFA